MSGLNANMHALEKGYYKAQDAAMEEKYLSDVHKVSDNNANDADDADQPLQQSAHGNPHDDDGDRETWGKKVDFLLSVIGFAVDLANVWRFPYLCYKNGGGAFLIPYTLMLALGGIPLFYMELALGQYMRKGAITCWGRICPLFKGIGYAVVLIAFYTDFFYNVIISWAIYFFFASFTKKLPWTSCDNEWNTEHCNDFHLRDTSDIYKVFKRPTYANPAIFNSTLFNLTGLNSSYLTNETFKYASPAQEYFERGVLEIFRSSGLENLGTIKWQLMLCLLAVYIICYFSLWKGISTSGKVVWFTAVFPYVVLFILLIRGVTLPGADVGIKYYLTPKWERLVESQVWVDAATQVFFSLGPGFGVLLAFASYNKFHNNVYRDAIATSIVNCATSFLSGFVIFSILGYMAYKTDQTVDTVATEGPGLVFTVYPEAIATLPGSTVWSLIFFLMLLTLGLDSSFGGSEAIITALSDEIPLIKKHREIFVGGLFSLYFLVGLASCTYGGMYVVTLMERFAAGYSILIAVFFETLVVSWFYGVSQFSDDIKQMMGFSPGMYWRICWAFIAPMFILFIVIFGLVEYKPVVYDGYTFPWWAELIGWLMALSSILCIPGVAIYVLITTDGNTLFDKLRNSTMPWKVKQKLNRLNGTKKGAEV